MGSAAKLLTKDNARRIAANITKLSALLTTILPQCRMSAFGTKRT
jgi:hypothetical protein